MSYLHIGSLATDGDFRQRIAACVTVQQVQASANIGDLHPTAWADLYQWKVSAAPGFGAAYASAVAGGVERPGADPSVISDEQLLAAVAPLLKPSRRRNKSDD